MRRTLDLEAIHLVLGFGVTGLSIVRTLKILGVRSVWAMDNRETPPHLSDMEMLCEKFVVGEWDQSLLSQCDYLWVSPGISLATANFKEVVQRLPRAHIGGDVELFAQLVRDNIIGITGTNGKSTVTTLVGRIIHESGRHVYVGGNLGEPVLNLWANYQSDGMPEDAVFVLELSSFQLDTTYSLALSISVIINISPDHLDRYNTYEDYCRSKFRIFDQSHYCISNLDDEIIQKYPHDTTKKFDYFSLKNPQADWYLDVKKGNINHLGVFFISILGSKLGGLHNLSNIMVSTAMAHRFGVDKETIVRGIVAYQPLPHRCTLVRKINGVDYYNDSKATNIASTEAAITGFEAPKWVILGGGTKGQDFSSLRTLLTKNVKGVYLIGLSVDEIVKHIPKDTACEYVIDLPIALKKIHARAKKGDVVLFSPACTSYDQYQNFEHRGEVFSKLVNEL